MKKEKAKILKLIKKTAGGFHAWYLAYLPREKKEAVIRKPIQKSPPHRNK